MTAAGAVGRLTGVVVFIGLSIGGCVGWLTPTPGSLGPGVSLETRAHRACRPYAVAHVWPELDSFACEVPYPD